MMSGAVASEIVAGVDGGIDVAMVDKGKCVDEEKEGAEEKGLRMKRRVSVCR
jgi:hypothetical protein